MISSYAWFWLGLNLISIVILSFYSMMEMACVSFNKVRLQYYVSKGDKHAIRLNYMLHHPSYLFGTTLIGVNVALIFGSEFSRQFHSSIGLSPDLAPLSQVIIVVIFGELAPMFAARRYAEHMAMLGINFLYLSAILMKPILWAINLLTRLTHHFMGSRYASNPNIFLSQEELQKILEEHDEEKIATGSSEDFNAIVSNIFNLREKTVQQVMTPLKNISMISSSSTIGEMRETLSETDYPFLVVYQQKNSNIIGIAFPRDLVREPDSRKIRDHIRQPWFITQRSEILQILTQFRYNNQTLAVVIDEKGLAVGILTLEDVIEEIFGKTRLSLPPTKHIPSVPLIELTVPGNMKIADFNRMYEVRLKVEEDVETFSDLIIKVLAHHPEEGESIYIPPFELQVKETSLLEVKSVTIKTKIT